MSPPPHHTEDRRLDARIVVLHVGPYGPDLREASLALERADDRLRVRTCPPGRVSESIEESRPDCVLTHRSLGESALDLLAVIETTHSSLPVVVCSESVAVAAEAVSRGASDCLVSEDDPGGGLRIAGRVVTVVRLDRAEALLEREATEGPNDSGEGIGAGALTKARAMDAAPVGAVLTDPSREDDPILYANGAFEALTGYRSAEVVGRNCRFLQGEGTDPEAVAALREGIDAERRVSVTLRNYRRDGTPFQNRVTVAPLYDDDGELVNYVGFQSDVTELGERTGVLEELHRIISDRERSFERKVDDLLSVGRRVLGTQYATLSRVDGDRYTFEVVHAPDERIEPGDVVPLSRTNCERVVATERRLVVDDLSAEMPELATRPGNVDLGLVRYLGTPVFAEDDVYGTVCFYDHEHGEERFSPWEATLVDLLGQWVTYELERERLLCDLVARNDRLEEVTTVLSHDLQNPLEVAEARLRFAREDGSEAHFETVEAAHDRMRALIDDLLALAKEGGPVTEREPVDLAATVERCWEETATREATLSVETERVVLAEEVRLERLVENLLRNAVVHGGPAVTVRVGDHATGFYVEDDGPGMPEGIRDRVFESGFTTADDGTGLGLAIVSRIAGAHGWEVSAEERVGGGTRVLVSSVESA